MNEMYQQIRTVAELLALPSLAIPNYQRPYKWTEKNLNDLVSDLRLYRGKSAYRLGTVVFHCHYDTESQQDQMDIVDGQQRTLTLFLLVRAILLEKKDGLKRQKLKDQLNDLERVVDEFLGRQTFSSLISQSNLHNNFMAARRVVKRPEFTEEDIDFLLNRCQLATFSLSDISEAFQFFDSQNARGRDLAPHDLLKAFHLREFPERERDLQAEAVCHWESLDSNTLEKTFADYLYRIRNWAQGKSARYFGKNDVGVFKGVNLDKTAAYPYTQSLTIAHYFVDEYNGQYQRHIDQNTMGFPFHLDQMVVNGRRFFEMISHYQGLLGQVINHDAKEENMDPVFRCENTTLSESAAKIIYTLNTYEKRTRTGDQCVRNMFDCALVFYVDKFGFENISEAIEKIFIWAYSCRIRNYSIGVDTVDKYVLRNNVFNALLHATHPINVLNMYLPTIKAADQKGTGLDGIISIFKDRNYYE